MCTVCFQHTKLPTHEIALELGKSLLGLLLGTVATISMSSLNCNQPLLQENDGAGCLAI